MLRYAERLAQLLLPRLVLLRPVGLRTGLLRRVLLTRERRVLFICVENAGRSLMAEAMFNADPPPGWRAESAGTRPATEANPRTTRMLEELGLTLPPHPPRLLTQESIDGAELRITMGCLDDASCPANLKQLQPVDWALPDPSRLDDAGARRVRDTLRDRVDALRAELVSRANLTGPQEPSSR
ncbi:MAG: low molecular weight phosphatase family protein [Thermoplasmata archaeon]|nr:low molecular weight phosphatase family protein [Thermoplasmata archaeon]